MNLKDAFRFQNKLALLTQNTTSILTDDANVTITETTYLRKKVVPDAEDEVILSTPHTEFSENINQLVDFLVFLLEEREKLGTAIHDAKAKLDIDFDNASSINHIRHSTVEVFRHMADLRSCESIVHNGGHGYRFNAEGNQVSYRCDKKDVTTINFNRNTVRSFITKLSKKADEVSSALDAALINSQVDYALPFNVNDSFTEIFTAYCENHPAKA